MELHFIRHTPVDLPSGICYGHADVDVTVELKKFTDTMTHKIDSKYDLIISSPSQRCTKLARSLGFKKFITDERLKELNFGDWELQLWNDIDKEKIDEWSKNIVHYQIPNGESLLQLFERVKSFYDEISTLNKDKILIVTHAGVIRCIWSLILDIPLENITKIPIGFGENFIVDTTYRNIKQKG